jgi:hypothetical protein
MTERNTHDRDSVIEMPEALKVQLRRFEHRLFRMESFMAVCGTCIALLASYGVLLYFDRLLDTPSILRLFLVAGAAVTCALLLGHWLHHWWWRRRDNQALARLVQRNLAGLGDRLLGAVELASGHSPPAGMSPALCRAAVQQVAQETARYDFATAVPMRRPRLAGSACLFLLVVVLAPALIFPEAGRNAFARWMRPLADIERYTFARLEALPALMHVAHGEPFEIACRVEPWSQWKPAIARVRINGGQRASALMQDGAAILQLHGVTRETAVQVRIGDAVLRTTVMPVYRPELLRMTANVVLPAYLQREPQEMRLGSGRPSFLEGSSITLTGTVSRAIESAFAEKETSLALPVVSNLFVLAEVDAVSLSNDVAFTWVDTFGLQGAAPYILRSGLHTDTPPRVEIRGVDRVIAILDDEVVTFQVRADDDYGLRETWVAWNVATGAQRETRLPGGRQTVAEGAPDQTSADGLFRFSALTKGVPEDSTVQLRAFAVDYLPGRRPSGSEVYQIHVLNRAAHESLIRMKMDALHVRIEALAHEEERLLELSRELAALPAEQLSSTEVGSQLRDNRQSELENARQAGDLARQARQLLEEALRNGSVDPEAMQMWAGLAESLQRVSEREMPAAASALDQAAASTDQRASGVQDAMRLQEQILEELRRLEQLANRTVEMMQAKNFINRLLQAAAHEGMIAARLRVLLPVLIGLLPEQITGELREEVDALLSVQEQTRREAGTIKDDLPGFYSRTRLEAYDSVHKEMQQKHMRRSLQALSGAIGANQTMISMGRAAEWEEQFSAWAAMLKAANQRDCEGEGEGEQMSPSDLEVMFGLLHARQREESLRDQTRLVSDQTEDLAKHASDAGRLAAVQEDIAAGVRRLDGRADTACLQSLVKAVISEMDSAAALLNRPRADADVITVQTVIIEMLSGSGDDSGGAGQAMQMMMQSMGMVPGRSPGSGYAGGGPDALRGIDAASAGDGPDGARDRTVEQAGGAEAHAWPVEYRDALQEFFSILDDAL